MFAALLDTCVLWPSLQRDFLLSLAVEGLYRPVWSSAILAELEYEEAAKWVRRGADKHEAACRASRLISRMRMAFDDAEVSGWEALDGTYGLPTQMTSMLWRLRSGRYGRQLSSSAVLELLESRYAMVQAVGLLRQAE